MVGALPLEEHGPWPVSLSFFFPFPQFSSVFCVCFLIAMSVPSHGGPQPSCEVAPRRAVVVRAILDSFFRFRNLNSSSCHGFGFFCSRSSVCFVFLYFNIPRMFKLVFLQVVVLLDINTVFLDTSARGFNFFVLVFFLDCKERTFAWRAATLL